MVGSLASQDQSVVAGFCWKGMDRWTGRRAERPCSPVVLGKEDKLNFTEPGVLLEGMREEQ